VARFVIFGAGKIARGFIAHLLYLSGYNFAFVEADAALVDNLQARGKYSVSVLGAPEKDTVVNGFSAVSADDINAVYEVMAGAEVVFTAVGGKNLKAIAPLLAKGLSGANGTVNVITCENWKQPAAELRREVAQIAPQVRAGFAEAVVMRSAIDPTPEQLAIDPLTVSVQDYWRLPVDASGLIAPLPEIMAVEPIDGFAGFLERKFYTYNAANGAVSYLGALFGHKYIADAAFDQRIKLVLDMVYQETGAALSKRHGIPLTEQQAFALTSLDKLRDRNITDTVERNARDPLRKLGPDDRLVGSANLARAYGIVPEGLAIAIVAAANYDNPGDFSAEELKRLRQREGLAGVLTCVCKLEAGGALYELVLKSEAIMKTRGWI